jgi:vitamin B12 transporter
MHHRITAWAAFVSLVTAFDAAQAQETSLDPIVVTASREAERARAALANVTVITREDVERRQPQSTLDLLRGQAGIDVSRTGGIGSVTSVFMRGAESDQVLVLIDGVRASSATSGTFSFQQLNPAQIERIEIVRGPRSTLYGSDAIGGVIQIFTRELEGPHAAVEAGSYDTYRAQAGYGRNGAIRYSVNGAYVNSNGFSATNPGIAFGFDPDDDGYEERSVTANMEAELTQSADLAIRGWHSDGDVEFDIGESDTRNDTVSANLSLETLPAWRQTLSAGYARDDLETNSPTFPSETITGRMTLSWQNDIRLAKGHQLTAGADYYRDDGEFTSGLGGFDESVNDVGGYLNLRSRLSANDVELGLRYDEHSEFGGHTTGRIALGRRFTNSLRAFAAFGTAFKAPTLNELFFPGSGNPALAPEESRSTELGVSFRPPDAGYGLNANLFYTEIDELIETVMLSPTQFLSRNVSEATIKGLELGYDMDIGARWFASADVTLQDARNATTDTDLLLRADRKLSVSLTRSFTNGGSLFTELLLSSERVDFGGDELPGYGVVNLGLQYPLLKGLFLEGRVENLLDKDYELAAGFNMPGLSGYLGLSYAPSLTQ